MAACLSIMVGRSCTFFGINIVGNLIFYHCEITFYLWSLLVLSMYFLAIFNDVVSAYLIRNRLDFMMMMILIIF